MTQILVPIMTMGALGLLFALGLAFAYKKFKVTVDPRLEPVAEALPQANCGGCGFPGCQALAEAMVNGLAPPEACPVGGEETARRIAEILGLAAGKVVAKLARVHCRGTLKAAKARGDYQGVPTCSAARLLGGNKECRYGCLGFGDCVRACPFEAMKMEENGLPVVFDDKCTGCGKCVEACPRNIMELLPASRSVMVFCRSLDRGPVARKLCDNACIACGICARDFPQAIVMENYLARVVDESKIPPDRLSELGKCPTASIGLIEKNP